MPTLSNQDWVPRHHPRHPVQHAPVIPDHTDVLPAIAADPPAQPPQTRFTLGRGPQSINVGIWTPTSGKSVSRECRKGGTPSSGPLLERDLTAADGGIQPRDEVGLIIDDVNNAGTSGGAHSCHSAGDRARNCVFLRANQHISHHEAVAVRLRCLIVDLHNQLQPAAEPITGVREIDRRPVSSVDGIRRRFGHLGHRGDRGHHIRRRRHFPGFQYSACNQSSNESSDPPKASE